MSQFTAATSGLDDVLIHLEKLGSEARERLYAAVYGEALLLQAHVQAGKLSGQVLNQRTGVLRDRIHVEMEDTAGAIVATVGTKVKYARIHEYGGTIVPKVAKALRFVVDGKTIHAKSVTMPERSFLRSALSDREQQIRAALAAAVAGASA